MSAGRVIIITEASERIGTGHVRRCMRLAAALQKSDFEVSFLDKWLPSFFYDLIKRDFRLLDTSEEQDSLQIQFFLSKHLRESRALVIVDCLNEALHHLDFQEHIQKLGSLLMYFVFTNEHTYIADIILNQNIMALDQEYNTSEKTIRLLGTEYVTMDSAFHDIQPTLPLFEAKKEVMLVFFGGSDPNHLTVKLLRILSNADLGLEKIIVITTQMNSDLIEIGEIVRHSEKKMELVIDTDHIETYMSESKYSLNSGGTALWELAVTNCLQITIPNSDREKLTLEYCQGKDYVHALDSEMSDTKIIRSLRTAMHHKDNGSMVESFKTVVSSNGLENIITEILALNFRDE